MKTLKFLIIIIVATLFIVSCADDYLDLTPPQMVESEFYKDPDNIYGAVIGCYDILGWDGAHNSLSYFFADIIGRDGYKGGEGYGDQVWMNALIDFAYINNAETGAKLNLVWNNSYIAINRCNKVLENIDYAEGLSTKAKIKYIAEVRFLRAYFYFELIKIFGEVPLVDHLLADNEYQQKKAPLEDLYKFIEDDFKYASEYLPARSDVGYGKATKGAAFALLAKTYLYEKDWNNVLTYTNEVMNLPGYGLLNNYEDIFKIENENSEEIVFAIQFAIHLNEYGNQSNGTQLPLYMCARDKTVGGAVGWGFNCPTQEFANEFEDGDIRKDVTIIFKGETIFEGTEDEEIYVMDSIDADGEELVKGNTKEYSANHDKMLNQKHVIPESLQGTYPMDQPKNWIVCRYADVLLWNAEAKANGAGDGAWQTPLNLVRARAGLLNTTESDGLTAVYHERRVELGMEGHRFWDIVRQGRGTEVLGEYGFIEGTHNNFPIPQKQIDLNKGEF